MNQFWGTCRLAGRAIITLATLRRNAITGMGKWLRFSALFAVVIMTITPPAFAQTAFTLANRAAAKATDRYGDVPLGALIRTDERYNRDPLFQGPRGWDYWNRLADPKPYQDPNLWPDKRPTYFLGQLVMPAGSSLTIHGRFPYARYFKFNLYEFAHNTFVAIAGTSLPGYDIEPDPGSSNPYKVGADRLVKNRSYTIDVLAENPPKNPAEHPKNTVYVGRDGKIVMACFRIYVSDDGYDGAGWGRGRGLLWKVLASPMRANSRTEPRSQPRKSPSDSGAL
jgi:hypothetical protein